MSALTRYLYNCHVALQCYHTDSLINRTPELRKQYLVEKILLRLCSASGGPEKSVVCRQALRYSTNGICCVVVSTVKSRWCSYFSKSVSFHNSYNFRIINLLNYHVALQCCHTGVAQRSNTWIKKEVYLGQPYDWRTRKIFIFLLQAQSYRAISVSCVVVSPSSSVVWRKQSKAVDVRPLEKAIVFTTRT